MKEALFNYVEALRNENTIEHIQQMQQELETAASVSDLDFSADIVVLYARILAADQHKTMSSKMIDAMFDLYMYIHDEVDDAL